jgi:septal ring factor EnvC (AmiA/AmiB activator)
MEGMAWWKSGLFAALLSAAIPGATFVQGWLQKGRELELQKQQQLQELRMGYMQVMVEAGVEGMELLADFIADTEDDPAMKEWAAKQRKKARATADALRARLGEETTRALEAERRLAEAAEKAATAEERAEQLAARAAADREAREQAEAAAAAARQARAAASAAAVSADTARTKVERSYETLSGKVPDSPVQQMAVPKASRYQDLSLQMMRQP